MELSTACYFGDQSVLQLQLSDFIGTPNKLIVEQGQFNKVKSEKVSQKMAAELTLQRLAQHEKASIRAKSKLQILKRKFQSEKLDAVIEMIVKLVDPENFEVIMNDTMADPSVSYLDVLRVFMKRFGDVNPDDFVKLNALKALAEKHTKTEIIQAIFAVI